MLDQPSLQLLHQPHASPLAIQWALAGIPVLQPDRQEHTCPISVCIVPEGHSLVPQQPYRQIATVGWKQHTHQCSSASLQQNWGGGHQQGAARFPGVMPFLHAVVPEKH